MKIDVVNRFVMARLSRLRQEKGITLAQLAKGSCIPLGTISSLLTGRNRCSLLNLYRLLVRLGLDITDVWPDVRYGCPILHVPDEIVREGIEEAEAALPQVATAEDVVCAIAAVFGVTYEEMCSPSRKRRLSEARGAAAYLVHRLPGIPMVRLSEVLRRNVSGLFHLVKTMRRRFEFDEKLRDKAERAARLLP